MGQLGDEYRRQASSVILKILLVLLPEDVIPGLDRRCHGMFGFYVTYQGRSKGHIQLKCVGLLTVPHLSLVNFNTLLSVCYTDKAAPLAFEGDSVAADGHDGVVHVILTLQRRVDVHHLKVHWDTAEPAKQNRQTTRGTICHVGVIDTSSRVFFFFPVIPSNLKTSRT